MRRSTITQGEKMILWGRFDRSPCYWGKYITLTGEPRLIHATVRDIMFYAHFNNRSEVIDNTLINDYFHKVIKDITDSATYSKNTAKLKRERLTRIKSNA